MPFFANLRHLAPVHSKDSLKPSEESALYIAHTIRSFALSLSGIFIPIFIFQLENKPQILADPLKNNIAWILVFYLIRQLVIMVAIFSITKLIFIKLKFRLSILLSQIILVLLQLTLYFSFKQPALLFIAGMLEAFVILLYWIPYHIFFVRKSNHQTSHFGKETGLREFLVRIVSALGPIIGGIVIALFGFKPLFVVALVLTIASAIPVLLEVHEGVHHEHDSKKILKEYILNPNLRLVALGYIGQGIENMVYVIFWPVLLFLVLDNFSTIGLLTGGTVLISSFSALVIARKIDRAGSNNILTVGVGFATLFHMLRILLNNPITIYLLDLFDKITNLMYSLPLITLSYEHAHKHGASNFILYREIILHFSMLLTVLVCFVGLLYLSEWRYLFILAAFGTVLSSFLRMKS